MITNNSQSNNNNNSHALNIAYWNSSCLVNKLVELENFMGQQTIDIMMVLETRTDTVNSISIDGYICYLVLNPESTRKGGVAIYYILIKTSGIRHSNLSLRL